MDFETNNIKCLYQTKLLNANKILNKALDKYESSEIFISFNGGKDCTVLLHLIDSLFSKKYPNKKLMSLYIQPESPFDEIEDFIRESELRYKITVEWVRGTVKGALAEMCQRYPQLRACLMGCRRTDPYCEHLNEFQKTDLGWPPLMRINPLLNWTCQDIWTYLNEHNVPYCLLYKKGYTSIGDTTNTVPNPFLKRRNSLTGTDEYMHADQLINGDQLERAGRF